MADFNLNINKTIDKSQLTLKDQRKSEKFQNAVDIAMFGFNTKNNAFAIG